MPRLAWTVGTSTLLLICSMMVFSVFGNEILPSIRSIHSLIVPILQQATSFIVAVLTKLKFEIVPKLTMPSAPTLYKAFSKVTPVASAIYTFLRYLLVRSAWAAAATASNGATWVHTRQHNIGVAYQAVKANTTPAVLRDVDNLIALGVGLVLHYMFFVASSLCRHFFPVVHQ